MPATLAARRRITQHGRHLSGSNRLKKLAAASAMLALGSICLLRHASGRKRIPRALQGAGRDQHLAFRRRLHARRATHGGASRGRRIREERARDLRAAGSSEGRRAGRGLSRTRREAQGHAAAGAHRRGRSETRGLDPRSVHAGRRRRQVLCTRRGRRQGRGRDFRGFPGAAARREIQATPHHQARAHLRRGNHRARSMARTGSSKTAANSSMPHSW